MRFSALNSKKGSPFDCRTCDRQDEFNCGNKHQLIESSIMQEGFEPYPLWFKRDLKSKLPNKGKFPTAVFKLGNIRLYECPLTWISKDTTKIMKMLFLEDNPPLIFPGTWLNQPQWYMEAIHIYRKEKIESLKNG